MATRPSVAPQDHEAYMRYALELARKSPPKPTNFCVGAVLVDELANEIISEGFTLELPGNTHAEQCCLSKFSAGLRDSDSKFHASHQMKLAIYTTMEPCSYRASGNLPCVDRILQTLGRNDKSSIRRVYVGVQEPEKFVGANEGKQKLEEAGVEYIHIPGLEKDILEVATAGHESQHISRPLNG